MYALISTDITSTKLRVQTSKTSSPSGEPMVWLTVDRDNTMVETVWLTKLQAQQLAIALLNITNAEG